MLHLSMCIFIFSHDKFYIIIMDACIEYEMYRRKYLSDYYRRVFVMSDQNDLLYIHRHYITTKYTFAIFEGLTIYYLFRKSNKSLQFIAKKFPILLGITLINM